MTTPIEERIYTHEEVEDIKTSLRNELKVEREVKKLINKTKNGFPEPEREILELVYIDNRMGNSHTLNSKDGKIERFRVNREYCCVDWYRQGSLEINGSNVEIIRYKDD